MFNISQMTQQAITNATLGQIPNRIMQPLNSSTILTGLGVAVAMSQTPNLNQNLSSFGRQLGNSVNDMNLQINNSLPNINNFNMSSLSNYSEGGFNNDSAQINQVNNQYDMQNQQNYQQTVENNRNNQQSSQQSIINSQNKQPRKCTRITVNQ